MFSRIKKFFSRKPDLKAPDLKAITREEAERLRRRQLIAWRAKLKAARLELCSTQAKTAKAKLIFAARGCNGRSMNRQLLAKHGI